MGSAEESTTGPASLMLFDPNGNPVLIDQHVGSLSDMKNKTGGKNVTPPTSLPPGAISSGRLPLRD
jgi:hypothetical protein